MDNFKNFLQTFRQKKWLWGVALGIITVTAILTYQIGKGKEQSNNPFSFLPNITQQENTLETPKDTKTLTLLLLGYGGAGHEGGSLSDVIQVIHLNFEKHTIALISVPRDLWVSLPSGTENKINAAYSMDMSNKDEKATISRKMIETVIGIPVDYYIAVDFVGFQRIIGQELGGIDVQVSEALDDPWYPIKGEELNTCGKTAEEVATLSSQYSGFELEKQFECRYEHLSFSPGTVHMEGGDALKFVRSRHGSQAGDFSRSQRQHEVLQAIQKKLFSLEGIDNIPGVYKEFASHTQTDLNGEIAEYLWPTLKATKDYKVISITLSTENVFSGGKSSQGASILQPKGTWKDVHSYIQKQLGN